MEAESLKVIFGEIKEGMEGRMRAEQEMFKYKEMYENSLHTIIALKKESEGNREKIVSLEALVNQLQNQVCFLKGSQSAIMQLSDIICMNSSKFEYSLTHFGCSIESVFTTIAVVENSLYDGCPKEDFDEVKQLAYKQAGKIGKNSFYFGEGSQATINTDKPKE